VIDTERKLTEFLPQLPAAEWVAVDTEADSLHAYPEKLCLLQLSIPGSDVLVDPLARIDLAPLWDALRGHELIFHGADYDLRLLRKGFQFVPKKIFDTMLAARLLGSLKFGLSDLIAKHLCVTLEKGAQKANWARRPLTPRMEAYAQNDTHYLKPLAGILKNELREKGRLAWHEESCARLIEDCSAPRAAEPDLVWRVKGSHRLGRAALGVLREIWLWREQVAVSVNKPPYFVLKPETMVAVAAAATTANSVEKHLPHYFPEHRKSSFFAAIERGQSLSTLHQPDLLRSQGTRLTQAQKNRLEALLQQRDDQAKKLGLDPTVIASRSTLISLAVDRETNQRQLLGWQRELLRGEKT